MVSAEITVKVANQLSLLEVESYRVPRGGAQNDVCRGSFLVSGVFGLAW